MSYSDDEDAPRGPPPLPPKKNINVFVFDESEGFYPPEIFAGNMGELPLLVSVNVGYDPENEDPYMCHYESQEIFFAYRKGAQRRVLMQDSNRHFLSLPVQSSIPFRVGSDEREVTMAQVVKTQKLPVIVRFSRPECMDFIVEGQKQDANFFGQFSILKEYDERYLWCLAVEGNGNTGPRPKVLPWNLSGIAFSPVVEISGVNDRKGKVKEFLDRYTRIAEQMDRDFKEDPFFQELAIITKDGTPVTEVKPYIDYRTFVTIEYKRRPAPDAPEIPRAPPRVPIHSRPRDAEHALSMNKHQYSTLTLSSTDGDDHVYFEIGAAGDGTKTKASKPLKNPSHEKLNMKSFEAMSIQGHLQKQKSEEKASPEQDKRYPLPLPKRDPPEGSSRTVVDESARCGRNIMAPPKLPPRVVSRNLQGLSVEDVGKKLKALGLGKYVKKFHKNSIDGVLMQRLTDHVLKSEFEMTDVEILKLNTFITDGHIPQQSSKKSHFHI